MMATGEDSVKVVEKLGVEKVEKGKNLSKKKNVKKDGDESESESGFWFRFKLLFSCISSRSKVDSSMNATIVIGNSLSHPSIQMMIFCIYVFVQMTKFLLNLLLSNCGFELFIVF